MIVPIRCFSCGKPIGHLFEGYREGVESGKDPAKVFNELGLKRYCCRQVLMGTVDMMKEVSQFKP